jgi:Cu/Ag efflux protein CusF
MRNSLSLICCLALSAAVACSAFGQDAPAPKAALDHVLGTITAVDKAEKTVTVKEDKTGTVELIQLANTKTLLKVEPTAKDLKSAVRITSGDLEEGDRVDVRGTKLSETPVILSAKSVILMSARDLELTHKEQAAAWARATSGRVTAVDPASGKITVEARVAGAPTAVTVQTAPSTEFTRYDPATGKPAPSQISQIQPGDQLKVLGEKNADGTAVTGQKVYTGAFRTISVTISSLGADGKSITAKDLATKKEIQIDLNADASIHKLPPMMAAFLARRLNPAAAGATPAGAPAGAMPAGGPPAGGGMPAGGPPSGGPGGAGPGGPSGRGRGDISQMIDNTPKIPLTDLKPGDALVISGVATGPDNSKLLASTIIAGVEPILQSAPAQRGGGRSLGGDWGLGEMSAPQ